MALGGLLGNMVGREGLVLGFANSILPNADLVILMFGGMLLAYFVATLKSESKHPRRSLTTFAVICLILLLYFGNPWIPLMLLMAYFMYCLMHLHERMVECMSLYGIAAVISLVWFEDPVWLLAFGVGGAVLFVVLNLLKTKWGGQKGDKKSVPKGTAAAQEAAAAQAGVAGVEQRLEQMQKVQQEEAALEADMSKEEEGIHKMMEGHVNSVFLKGGLLFDILEGGLGAIPGLGYLADITSLLLQSAFLFYTAFSLKMPGTAMKMALVVLVDFAVGLIPVVGDLVDFFIPSAVINASILRSDLKKKEQEDIKNLRSKHAKRRKSLLSKIKHNEAGGGKWSGFTGIMSKMKFDTPLDLVKAVFGIGFALLLLTGCFAFGASSYSPDSRATDFSVSMIQVFCPYCAGELKSGRFQQRLDVSIGNVELQLETLDPLQKIVNWWNQSYYEGLGQYYTGTIEDAQGVDLGLRLEGLTINPPAPTGEEGEFEVNALVRVRGGTFNQEIDATPYCLINDEPANTDPERIVIIDQAFDSIECYDTINTETDTVARVDVGVKYNFEVWSYIPFTFVTKSTYNQYRDTINDQLAIEAYPQSLSTAGPVSMAIGSQDFTMPIWLDETANEENPAKYFVGFTLQNVGLGDITKVDKVFMLLPKGTRLDDEGERSPCFGGDVARSSFDQLRDEAGSELEVLSDYEVYLVDSFAQDPAQRGTFTTDCRVIVDDPKTFIGPVQKAEKTIIVLAMYDYELKQSQIVSLPLRGTV